MLNYYSSSDWKEIYVKHSSGRTTHNVVSVVSAPHHLGRHVLDGAAEGVGPALSLVRRELAAQTLKEFNNQSRLLHQLMAKIMTIV